MATIVTNKASLSPFCQGGGRRSLCRHVSILLKKQDAGKYDASAAKKVIRNMCGVHKEQQIGMPKHIFPVMRFCYWNVSLSIYIYVLF